MTPNYPRTAMTGPTGYDEAPGPPRKTLLDEFAMAALTGLLARVEFNSVTYVSKELVKTAWGYAELMLAEKLRREGAKT